MKVKLKNMTGSEIIEAELLLDSGLVSYEIGNKKTWNHVTNLSAKGWEIYEELIPEPVVFVKKSRGKKQ